MFVCVLISLWWVFNVFDVFLCFVDVRRGAPSCAYLGVYVFLLLSKAGPLMHPSEWAAYAWEWMVMKLFAARARCRKAHPLILLIPLPTYADHGIHETGPGFWPPASERGRAGKAGPAFANDLARNLAQVSQANLFLIILLAVGAVARHVRRYAEGARHEFSARRARPLAVPHPSLPTFSSSSPRPPPSPSSSFPPLPRWQFRQGNQLS